MFRNTLLPRSHIFWAPNEGMIHVDKFLCSLSDTAGSSQYISGLASPPRTLTNHISLKKKNIQNKAAKRSQGDTALRNLSIAETCTQIPTNSFSGLVRSYLSHYSSFPRAPPMGLLANMLMSTNGGNLSVPGMSLGYREREFHIQLEASEW